MKKYFAAVPIITLIPNIASAHCPLCTIGAGALAVLAASLGVSSIVVGVLIGAFALALSLWIAGAIKKKYVPLQKHILTVVVFLGTVIPIMPLIEHYGPLYIPFMGEYGTTYTINLYILGVVIGGFVMLVSPLISRLVTKVRSKRLPFQGLGITLVLLLAVSIIIQLMSQ